MKKVLILGGSGMLGHKAYQILSDGFDTYVAFKHFDDRLKKTGIFKEKKVIDKIDVFQFSDLVQAVENIKPDFLVNCIGIIKQLKDAKNSKISIYVNALLPHLLEELCSATECKLIHISTDCVFSGRKGTYSEKDIADAEDLYGKTKFLGEVSQSDAALTLRTSIIGRELFSQNGLIEWFLSQNHQKVNGYTNAIYTGLTTIALCKEIKRVITDYPHLSGLYQVSSNKISKYELLEITKNIYGLDIELLPHEAFHCDRSLDSTQYHRETGFQPLSWEDMIQEMFQDPTPYHTWRGK